MAKKRWFRFHIDNWLNGTFGLTPNEIAAMITILCELYDKEGFARLDVDLWARRCGMRPTSFRKALDALVGRGKVVVESGFVTSPAVDAEIKSREKLDEKSVESRAKLAKKNNELMQIREKLPSNTEDRIQKDNLRGSALHQGEGLGGKERQLYLAHAITGGKKENVESKAVAGMRARQAARR